MSYHRRYKVKDYRFGQSAQTLREKVGLTQPEVATVLGVSVRTIRHWEGGTAYPAAAHLKHLIELYLRQGAFVRAHEREEVKALWEQAAESGAHYKARFDEEWFDVLLTQLSASPHPGGLTQSIALSPPSLLLRRADWGEAMDVTAFYGREPELTTLSRWVLKDQCRLVLLLGMGGIGKTALSIKFAHQVAPDFEFVFWRSLRNAPPLEEVVADCLQLLTEQQYSPQSRESSIALLFDLMRKRRCLFILDNAEMLLQAGSFEGHYREEYEGYRHFIQRMAEMTHQSCLLLTSREMPSELEPLAGTQSPVRALKVFGLGRPESQELLKDKELFGAQETWDVLVEHYAGNPLALKMAAATIREVFGGNIATFLREGPVILHTVRQLLDYQFERLSGLERELMYWLAIERDPVPLEEVSGDLKDAVPKREVLAALQSLRWRCLLERAEPGVVFTLQAVVLEYVSERLVEQVCEEVKGANPELLLSHTLIKADSSDYLRKSQVRILIQPVLRRLVSHYGSEGELEGHPVDLVQVLREKPSAAQGYGGGNVVNLLACLRGQIRGIDFSHLLIRHAYLQGIEAQDASFVGSNLSESVFMETFDSIMSVALSSNGKYLAAGSFQGEIHVWHVADGKPLATFMAHTRMVWSLAFSPDSTLLVSGGYDHSVKLWKIGEEGSVWPLRIESGHTKWVRSVVFSPDGSTIASAGDDETIRVWDTKDGTCLNVLPTGSGIIWSVTFSPDGQNLLSGSDNGTVKLWEISTGQCLRTLSTHSGRVFSVAFHPDGKVFASSGEGHNVHLWEASSGQSLGSLHGSSQDIFSIAFGPDGTLASGSDDGMVKLWEPSRWQYLRTLQVDIGRIWSVAFGPGSLLASGSDSGTVKLWETASGQCLRALQGHHGAICATTFSPDESILVHGDDSGVIRVWGVAGENNGRCIKTLHGHVGRIWSLTFHPDGETFASGGNDRVVKLWELSSGRCLKTFQGHTGEIWSVAFSPDGNTIASGSLDGTVRLWRVEGEDGGNCLRVLEGSSTWIWSVAFSPDGTILASGSGDGEVRLWDVSRGVCIKTLQGSASPIGSLTFSLDGKTLTSSSHEEMVKVWDVRSGHCLKTLQGHGYSNANWIRSVAFSRDSTVLATGSDDQMVKLWSVSSGECLRIFSGHAGRVWSVDFSPHGSLLASGDDDGVVVVWEVKTGRCHRTFRIDRPYERMNIRGVVGITEAQKASLRALGAVENLQDLSS